MTAGLVASSETLQRIEADEAELKTLRAAARGCALGGGGTDCRDAASGEVAATLRP
jgi:hypothetical protein